MCIFLCLFDLYFCDKIKCCCCCCFISRSVGNDRSAIAENTESVVRILSSIFIAGKISGWQSLLALYQTTTLERF